MIQFELHPVCGPRGRFRYRVAGCAVTCEDALPGLGPYLEACSRESTSPAVSSASGRTGDGPPVAIGPGDGLAHRGPAWLGGRMRELACAWRDGRCRIDVDGLAIELGASGPVRVAGVDRADPALVLEAISGPALVLSLALREIFTLHASAARLAGEAWIFLADSGVGKSTLARAFGPERLADDVLPVRLGAVPGARPGFPQLKLPTDAWYPSSAPEELPIGAFVRLEVGAPEGPVELTPVAARSLVLDLVRQTVCARLFERELLRAQLARLGDAARACPGWRLVVPRRHDRLPEVVARLRAEALAASTRRAVPGARAAQRGGTTARD